MNSTLTRSGKERVILELRAHGIEIQLIDGRCEHRTVRVAHGCTGDVILVTVDDDRLVDDHVAFKLYGHLLRAKRCRAHIDRNLVRLAVHRHDAARLDAALCLDIDDRLFHDAVVEEVLCDAADAVART